MNIMNKGFKILLGAVCALTPIETYGAKNVFRIIIGLGVDEEVFLKEVHPYKGRVIDIIDSGGTSTNPQIKHESLNNDAIPLKKNSSKIIYIKYKDESFRPHNMRELTEERDFIRLDINGEEVIVKWYPVFHPIYKNKYIMQGKAERSHSNFYSYNTCHSMEFVEKIGDKYFTPLTCMSMTIQKRRIQNATNE